MQEVTAGMAAYKKKRLSQIVVLAFFFFLERRIFSNLKKCRFSLFSFLGDGKCASFFFFASLTCLEFFSTLQCVQLPRSSDSGKWQSKKSDWSALNVMGRMRLRSRSLVFLGLDLLPQTFPIGSLLDGDGIQMDLGNDTSGKPD